MKLLRATCECGFRSRKARVGYDFHQWWFPLLDTTSGQLTDVSRSLPKDQVNLIQRNKARAEELHRPFLQRVTQELILQYADQSRTAFNPDFGSTFECPGCRRGRFASNR